MWRVVGGRTRYIRGSASSVPPVAGARHGRRGNSPPHTKMKRALRVNHKHLMNIKGEYRTFFHCLLASRPSPFLPISRPPFPPLGGFNPLPRYSTGRNKTNMMLQNPTNRSILVRIVDHRPYRPPSPRSALRATRRDLISHHDAHHDTIRLVIDKAHDDLR